MPSWIFVCGGIAWYFIIEVWRGRPTTSVKASFAMKFLAIAGALIGIGAGLAMELMK